METDMQQIDHAHKPHRSFTRIAALCLGLAGLSLGCQTNTSHAQPPEHQHQLFLYDAEGITQSKANLQADDPYLTAILADVVAKADELLEVEPVSVTDKPMTPPSGDKHDYMSMSPYWWPNPDTPDGKPYVRRDGEYNPERANYDVPKLDTVKTAVHYLSLAYTFTGDERYAEHAVKHLRHFYINPDTRMNPNLQFGQFVPGLAENGRKSGIIESIRMRFMPDAITLLKASDHLTDEDYLAMKQWFGDYVNWLLTSEHGVAEGKSENNHGTWYMQQVVLYSLFAGDEAIAIKTLELVPARIAAQIEPDGSQPHESTRTRSMHYYDFNNRAMMDMARLGGSLGVDLWGYETDDGRSLRKSLDYAAPYMTGDNPDWPHKMISEHKYQWYAQSMRWAAIGFNDPSFEANIDKFPNRFGENSWIELVVPAKLR